jgi:hypothetical protein
MALGVMAAALMWLARAALPLGIALVGALT